MGYVGIIGYRVVGLSLAAVPKSWKAKQRLAHEAYRCCKQSTLYVALV